MIYVSQFCIFLVFCYITMTSRTALGDIITDTSSPSLIPCEKEWFFYGNKCYKIFGQRQKLVLSWENAAKSCSEKGGQLAIIQTKELQDFLTYFLMYHESEDAWIGLQSRYSGSEYKWIDGSVVNYTNWDTGKPTGGKSFQEDCVEMGKWGKTETGMWNNVPCYEGRPYICETDKNEELNNPDPRFCSPEKGGGLRFFYSCYHAVALKKSWYDAETYCQDNFNGHLVTILNSKAQSFMDYMTLNFDKQFWIGIQVQDQSPWRWSSGWHLNFDRWDKQIDDFKNGSCGLRLDENQWTLAACAEEFPFICETHNTPPLLKEASQGWLCPNSSKDWIDLDGDSCYMFVTNTSRPWDEANYDCMTKGGALARIQSEEESKAIHPYVIGTQERLYIGLHRRLDDKNIFQLIDGSDLDYKNWDEGEPNYLNEECGEIWTDTMKWNDEKCHVAKGYICAAKKTPPILKEKNEHLIVNDSLQSGRPTSRDVITDTSSPTLIPCEKEWFFYGDKCYKIFGKDNSLEWDEARESCDEKGGQLVTIHTQELQDFLTNFLLHRAVADTWIGLNIRDSESTYKWSDGSVVNYTSWDVGEPDEWNYYYQGNCVEMAHWTDRTERFGMWRNKNCYNNRLYICQKDKNEQLSNPDPRFCSIEKGGGFQLFDSCYHTVALKKSWYDAEKYCQDNFNGHLITILNSKVQSFMDYMAQKFDKKFWIGIQVRDQTLQKWSSGWPVYFDKSNKGTEDFKEDSCGLRSDKNLWRFAQCEDKFPFICETHNTLPALKEAPKGWLCPDSSKNWKDLGGDKCYIFVTDTTRNWDDANADCISKGGFLAKIESEEESKALNPYVICTQTHLYIGLHRRPDNKNFFQWSDGSDLHYENWLTGEPNYLFEECVMAWTDNMKWYDEKCYNSWGYICSAKKVPPTLEEKDEKEEKEEHPINNSCQCECPAPPVLEEKKEHPIKDSKQCECPLPPTLEEKKEHSISDSLECVCPNYTGEKAALGVFIFICVILVVGFAVYLKRVPRCTCKLVH